MAPSWLRTFANIILDTVFPAKCLVCSSIFQAAARNSGDGDKVRAIKDIWDLLPLAHRLLTALCCPDCVKALLANSEPLCTCCGKMFDQQQTGNHLCGDCIIRPKKFRMARSAMVYDQQSMAIIHRFKYAGKIQLARPFGVLLLNTYLRYWHPENVDLIIPVPLHSKKFRRRGFNQAYLMVDSCKAIPSLDELNAFSRHLDRDVIVRSRSTEPQTGLGRRQRLNNIKGAFSVRLPEAVRGRNVLVVDDVYTTGATVDECARSLLNAGAVQVDVLTLARAI